MYFWENYSQLFVEDKMQSKLFFPLFFWEMEKVLLSIYTYMEKDKSYIFLVYANPLMSIIIVVKNIIYVL